MPTSNEKLDRLIEESKERLAELKASSREELTQEKLVQIGEQYKILLKEQKELKLFLDEIDKAQNDITKISALIQSYHLFEKEYSLKMFFHHLLVLKQEDVLKFGFESNWFKLIKWDEQLFPMMFTETPLLMAIEKSTISIAKLLITYGASLDNPYSHQKEKEKHTIKNHCLFFEKHVPIIHELIEFEKNIKEKQYLDSSINQTEISIKDKVKI